MTFCHNCGLELTLGNKNFCPNCGIKLQHLSRTRQAAVAIEIIPDDSAGSATKKRGIVLSSASEFDEFNRILSNEKLVELARKMNQVNPKQKEATSIGSSDVFEI